MKRTTLIIPGYRGSGPDHWQSWFEKELPGARRAKGIDWDEPLLATWANAVRHEIDLAAHPVWLVAHSFGCLASIVAAADCPDKVAGAMFVAPADPNRFTALGLRSEHDHAESVARWLPARPQNFPSALVASSNDPWSKLTVAAYWAQRWGSHFICAGNAGHINTDAGFGLWPEGLALLATMQQAQAGIPLGTFDLSAKGGGRASALTKIRHAKRIKFGS